MTRPALMEWPNTGRRPIYSWFMRLDTDEPLEDKSSDTH